MTNKDIDPFESTTELIKEVRNFAVKMWLGIAAVAFVFVVLIILIIAAVF